MPTLRNRVVIFNTYLYITSLYYIIKEFYFVKLYLRFECKNEFNSIWRTTKLFSMYNWNVENFRLRRCGSSLPSAHDWQGRSFPHWNEQKCLASRVCKDTFKNLHQPQRWPMSVEYVYKSYSFHGQPMLSDLYCCIIPVTTVGMFQIRNVHHGWPGQTWQRPIYLGVFGLTSNKVMCC